MNYGYYSAGEKRLGVQISTFNIGDKFQPKSIESFLVRSIKLVFKDVVPTFEVAASNNVVLSVCYSKEIVFSYSVLSLMTKSEGVELQHKSALGSLVYYELSMIPNGLVYNDTLKYDFEKYPFAIEISMTRMTVQD